MMYEPVRMLKTEGGWRLGVKVAVGRKYTQVLYLTPSCVPMIARLDEAEVAQCLRAVPDAHPDYIPRYAGMIRDFLDHSEANRVVIRRHLEEMEKQNPAKVEDFA